MKKTYLLFVLIGISIFIKAQIVNIPDANFKEYLLGNIYINTNGDNEIQVSEATAYTGFIQCGGKGIANLTGIEFFVNIGGLYCYSNNLTSLDVSKNINLRELWCHHNQLTNLDVSKNVALTTLWCEVNLITNLDVSKNTVLRNLDCHYNQLTNLDLSKNTSLATLDCDNNVLTSLNLKNGKNTLLYAMHSNNNPNLSCIQVDNVAYANQSNWYKDSTASYKTNCVLSMNETEKKQTKIYPNPAKDNLNFSEEVSNIKITDLSGKVITQISNSEKSLNVSKLSKGTYIITATTKTGETITKKFIKE